MALQVKKRLSADRDWNRLTSGLNLEKQLAFLDDYRETAKWISVNYAAGTPIDRSIKGLSDDFPAAKSIHYWPFLTLRRYKVVYDILTTHVSVMRVVSDDDDLEALLRSELGGVTYL